jgi:hypothetical protein
MWKNKAISPQSRNKTGENSVMKNGSECDSHLFGGWYPSDRMPGDVKYCLALSSHKMETGYKCFAFRARDK